MRPASSVRIDRVLITCEHGGREIPARWRRLFRGRERMLRSHRGWDPGAMELATAISRRVGAPLMSSETSRLLVDLNRSLTNASVFSGITAMLAEEERSRIIAEHYAPYRAAVEAWVQREVSRGEVVLHLSVHTFTPVLRGERRTTDVGLLFDPARGLEAALCGAWAEGLRRSADGGALGRGRGLVVHMNKPYKGTDDGLTTHLRGIMPAESYLGVELEVNQRFPRRGGRRWGEVRERVAGSLAGVLGVDRAAGR